MSHSKDSKLRFTLRVLGSFMKGILVTSFFTMLLLWAISTIPEAGAQGAVVVREATLGDSRSIKPDSPNYTANLNTLGTAATVGSIIDYCMPNIMTAAVDTMWEELQGIKSDVDELRYQNAFLRGENATLRSLLKDEIE
ncbi:MAG: hypothetical protein COA78_28400 [Blastopirellula sp.]|nr:MAG: hypothetical protein COA78_28400 [Blastopirellula sp.]